MFGRRQEDGGRPPVANPKGRAGLYGVCGLYLGYLLFQMLSPFITGEGEIPSTPVLVLGILILGGGMVVTLGLSWKMYRTPAPREDGEEPEADPPEDPEA